MRLTTKGRYAVTAMLDLALHDADGPVCLNAIAQRQHISLAYLEQLFTRLRRSGLVTSTRGPGGGYNLTRPAVSISTAEIIRAVDESWDATRCGGREDCQSGNPCLTHGLWEELSREIDSFLSRITLSELMGRESVQAVLRRQLGATEHPLRPLPVAEQ
jgi:Rrf2 family iron-sulfur cluster assembly transcriptional regulator